MKTADTTTHVLTFRPLVRYVDKSQAVIDAHFMFHPESTPESGKKSRAKYRHQIHLKPATTNLDVVLRMTGPFGKIHDYRATIDPRHEESMIRFDLPQPKRWWPSTLGNQALYKLTAVLIEDDNVVDTWESSLGLTSVRADTYNWVQDGILIVNGKEFPIHEIYPFTKSIKDEILPFTSDMLVHIKKHFAPDNLYDAADKAGVLLLQSVPFSKSKKNHNPLSKNNFQHIIQQVDRLASHPCIVGWHIPDHSKRADQLAALIHKLDPGRRIFRYLPEAC